jgi:3-oxoacyl-[acyl-carrier protein] reductase
VALVTGAGRGLGRAIALAFAREGAIVAVNDLQIGDEAREVVATAESFGQRAVAIQADVTQPDQVRAMVYQLLRDFGRIDVLVNNAGALPAGLPSRVPLAEMSLDYWNAYLGLNLTSVFLCAQAVIPAMTNQHHGRIINIGSQMAFKGHPDQPAYCAAKGGVVALTKSLARLVAEHGITVNCIAPGPMLTAAHKREGMTDADIAAQAAGLPLKRFASLDEITPTAVLLASSPDGDFYTGVTFHPNGGDVML